MGVILLSFLSRSYPFFRAPDDLTALAEITTLFGSKAINKAAQRYSQGADGLTPLHLARYGRVVTSSATIEPQALGAVCVALAERGEVLFLMLLLPYCTYSSYWSYCSWP